MIGNYIKDNKVKFTGILTITLGIAGFIGIITKLYWHSKLFSGMSSSSLKETLTSPFMVLISAISRYSSPVKLGGSLNSILIDSLPPEKLLFYVPFLDIILYALLVIAGFRYLMSNGQSNRLITILWQIVFVSLILNFIFTAIALTAKPNPSSFHIRMILFYLECLLLLIVSYHIVKAHLPYIHQNIPGVGLKYWLKHVVRIMHLLVDGLLITVLMIEPVSFFIKSRIIDSYLALILINYVVYIVYYTFLEGFFQRTPAKVLSRTFVIKLKSQKTHLGHIIVRTLTRFIPFDLFSFLFDANWHDTASGTAVLKEEYNFDEIGSVSASSKYHRSFSDSY